MTLSAGSDPLCLSISAVERDTGIAKETLRVWERRYGFPRPIRDSFGERVYPVDQVDRLRVIRRLVGAGFRPGKIVGQPLSQLMALSAEATAAQPAAMDPAATDAELDALRQCLLEHRIDRLRDRLRGSMLALGLGRFVHEVAVPLARRILHDGVTAAIRPFEERLFLEALSAVLREAIERIPARNAPPSVLLATVPQETMGLPLLLTECLLSLDGCRCLSLGTQAPVGDIALAAQACRSDIVLLLFTGAVNAAAVSDAVGALRGRLPDSVPIWLGGRSPALRRRAPAGATVIESLRDLSQHVAGWRRGPGEEGAEAGKGLRQGRLESLQLSVITGGAQIRLP